MGQITNDLSKVRGYRLPTEAEWEYSCRAGSTTPYNTGQSLTPQQANFDSRSGKTKEVGSYPPNGWGLYDMHGNVWEWCHDWYSDYSTGEQVNPTGPMSGNARVVRGGSDFNDGGGLRCAYRGWYDPNYWFNYIFGFRLVLSPC